MEIFSGLNENKNLSLALGYFDGVHKGHQEVIKKAVQYARKYSTKSAVITFKDHPCCYFWDVSPKYILTREERQKQIERLGIDYLYELDFGEIAHLNAEEYLEKILVKNFSPTAISTGFNHYFGANKSGNTAYLKEMANKYNYELFISEPVTENNEIISSTIIREALSQGYIKKANKMLGYNFPLDGTIIEGQKLGRQIGFRTANIVYPEELISLPFGVYKTKATINKNTYNAITNFGIRPTVTDSKIPIAESHILNFDENIYGEALRIEFIDFIREEKNFSNIENLKHQIKEDINFCIKSM